MNRILAFIGGAFLLSNSCRFGNDQDDCKLYYTYDEVVHLSYNGQEEYSHDLYYLKDGSLDDKLFFGWLVGDERKSLSDTSDFEKLKLGPFAVSKVPEQKFEQLNALFCERQHQNQMYAGCEPVYRDILIFRRNQKTIGIARLCFQCEMSDIVGTDRNTTDFGQSGDFHRLRLLLK